MNTTALGSKETQVIHDASLYGQQIHQHHMVNYLWYQGSMVLQKSWQGFKSLAHVKVTHVHP
jgi:hypothetical protein